MHVTYLAMCFLGCRTLLYGGQVLDELSMVYCVTSYLYLVSGTTGARALSTRSGGWSNAPRYRSWLSIQRTRPVSFVFRTPMYAFIISSTYNS